MYSNTTIYDLREHTRYTSALADTHRRARRLRWPERGVRGSHHPVLLLGTDGQLRHARAGAVALQLAVLLCVGRGRWRASHGVRFAFGSLPQLRKDA